MVVEEISKVSSTEPKEVKKALEFIKRLRGRPKVYADRKTQMREVMRRKRARERAKVLGDGGGSGKADSGSK